MYSARASEEPFEEAVLGELEEATKMWKPVQVREKYEWFWD